MEIGKIFSKELIESTINTNINKKFDDFDAMRLMFWYKCPHCGQRLFKIHGDTKIQNLEWVCKRCKQTIEVNI